MWQADNDDGPPQPPPRDRVWLHVLLFLTTFAATTLVGAGFYANFVSDLGYRRINISRTALLVGGLWYSVPALLILGSHEMGHYVACRYYNISATLPYFIPAPIVSLFGTLGAVIRIREPLRTKRILFDVGVAGPLAGFAVLLPALIIGIQWSEIMRQPPPSPDGIELGEPMLFQLVTRWFFGPVPEGYTLNAHPMAFASIFGLLATALNLLPIGQLDGGHLAYANLGPRAKYVTYATLGATLVLGVTISTSWLIWGALILVLLRLSGFEHPPTEDEHEPLDRGRIAVTILAVIIFALCFTPWPITPTDLISR
jgi:membrane-associated protease RseP (regulator of RpoE activity)